MREHEHALVLRDRALDDLSKDDRLAAARWCHDDRPLAGLKRLLDPVHHIKLIWAQANHSAPLSRSAMRSSAQPNGDDARPCASRRSALRMVSSGTPNWSPIEQTTAESFAAESLCEPAFAFEMKISASSPVSNRPIDATYASPLHSKANVSHGRRFGRRARAVMGRPSPLLS